MAAVLCSVLASACKKDEKKYCYACSFQSDNEAIIEQCELTEEDGKSLEAELNKESDETIVCSKK
jgi:hypothetical protein